GGGVLCMQASMTGLSKHMLAAPLIRKQFIGSSVPPVTTTRAPQIRPGIPCGICTLLRSVTLVYRLLEAKRITVSTSSESLQIQHWRSSTEFFRKSYPMSKQRTSCYIDVI